MNICGQRAWELGIYTQAATATKIFTTAVSNVADSYNRYQAAHNASKTAAQ